MVDIPHASCSGNRAGPGLWEPLDVRVTLPQPHCLPDVAQLALRGVRGDPQGAGRHTGNRGKPREKWDEEPVPMQDSMEHSIPPSLLETTGTSGVSNEQTRCAGGATPQMVRSWFPSQGSALIARVGLD